MFDLKNFQKVAIDQLSNTFLELWKTGKYRLPLIFKAPTGSGKTVMMAEFLRCLDDNYHFDEDKAYLWVSFGGSGESDSYSQSKNKLFEYFNDGTDMNLKNRSNLNEGKLYKNNIFFINWSAVKGTDKESKKLRKPNENTEGKYGIFDEFIKKTRNERELVLIIDEAHTETDTSLANELIDLINPRIIIKITATPKDEREIKALAFDKQAGFVEALEKDVIQSGLIKQKIIIQTEEDIKKLSSKKMSEDEIMLELAYGKREELKKLYNDLGLDINPLIMIQLPSDFKEKEELQANQKDIVLSFLKEKGVKDNEVAIWLSNEKKNLELIEKNNSGVNYLIFKVAPATGWDCPRADILVMFREITSPTFHTQIIGRIKRMPEGFHYANTELNNAYIYTNYNKSHIRDVKQVENQNKLPIYFTELRKGIERIPLETTFHYRTDFNTLTPPPLWQKFFLDVFDKEFGTINEPFSERKNYEKVKSIFDIDKRDVSNKIIVDAQIESFDNFINEIKKKGKDINFRFSPLDVEKLYNLACFEELRKQVDDEAKYNPSRSWGQLKSALNVWFNTRLGMNRNEYYSIIVNELLKETSDVKIAINKALKEFRKKYEITIKEKEEKDIFDLQVPEKNTCFTDEFEPMRNIQKNAYKEFFIRKEYKGKINEEKFIKFLEEKKNIIWWHKQDDSGRNSFAIEYYHSQDKKTKLFYPDFIIKTNDTLYIIDTKDGETAKSQETADKNKALQEWIVINKKKFKIDIIGGIVIEQYPNWKINKKTIYIYESDYDWDILKF